MVARAVGWGRPVAQGQWVNDRIPVLSGSLSKERMFILGQDSEGFGFTQAKPLFTYSGRTRVLVNGKNL